MRARWQLKPSDRMLVCIANLAPVKGVDVLLRAFKMSATGFPNWKLLIVGDNNNNCGESLMDLTKELKLDDQVIFCGKQFDVASFLSMAECAVLPTLAKGEGSPVALLEAMSSGLNVLGSDVPGIRDQLEPFPDHLVPSEDISHWALALTGVFENSVEQNKALGKIFRTHVLNHYSLNTEIDRTEKMYRELV